MLSEGFVAKPGAADVEGGRRMDARSSVLGGAEVAALALGRMRASVFGAY